MAETRSQTTRRMARELYSSAEILTPESKHSAGVSPTSSAFVIQKLPNETSPSAKRENDSNTLVANELRMAAYAVYKKNDYFLKGKVPFPLKTVPHVIDFTANLVTEEKSESLTNRLQNSAAHFATDILVARIIGGGPTLAAELVGSAGEFMEERVDAQITQLSREEKPGMVSPEKLETLRNGRALLGVICLPKTIITGVTNGIIDGVSWSYNKVINSASHAQNLQRKLFNQLTASARRDLEKQKEYLLYRVNKSDKQSLLASDFMRTAAFKNELYNFQYENKLSAEQTQLLALYVAGSKTGSLNRSPAERPSVEAVHQSLGALKQTITADLTKSPGDSIIFQAIKQSTAQSLVVRSAALTAHQIDDICVDITTVTHLGSHMARLTNCPKMARQITAIGLGTTQCLRSVSSLSSGNTFTGLAGLGSAIGAFTGNTQLVRQVQGIHSGATQLMGGLTALSLGNPITALIGLGSAFSSLIGGFFGGDDEDEGLSALSSQISQMNNTMIEGFNTILHQQVELANGLSCQMTLHHEQSMERFDRVDYNIGIVQQQIQCLAIQNSHIIEQINTLSTQVSAAEAHILEGLQVVHRDFVRCIQTLNESINHSFSHLDTQLTLGFNQLAEQNQLLTREMNARIAEDTLHSRQLFTAISREQLNQTQQLNQYSLQQVAFQQASEHYQNQHMKIVHERKISELTKHADYILLSNTNIEKSQKAKLLMALSKAENVSMIISHNMQWETINPFDYLNILDELGSYIHFSSHQKNMHAFIKFLMEQPNVTLEDRNVFAKEIEKYRNLLRLCSDLASPDRMIIAFGKIEQEVKLLGDLLEQMLIAYEKQLTEKLQNSYKEKLLQHEINRSRLRTENPNDIETVLQQRNQQELAIKLFATESTIQYPQPSAYYVLPENTTFVLPLTQDKIPPIPKDILELEGLNQGDIKFSYKFDAAAHHFKVNIKFELNGGSEYILYAISIPANQETEILNAWRQFADANNATCLLSTENQNELKEFHKAHLIAKRLQLNKRLQDEIATSTLVRKCCNRIEENVNRLVGVFKLIFESFYQNKDQNIQCILSSCLTEKSFNESLTNYDGIADHPFAYFKDAKRVYDQLAMDINNLIQNRTLYVDNLSINNALILFNQAMLDWLPEGEKLCYLNQEIASLPSDVSVHSLLRRGDFHLSHEKNITAALAEYQAASNLHPDDNFIRTKMAHLMFAAKQYDDAAQTYTQVLENIDAKLVQIDEASDLNRNLWANKASLLLARGASFIGLNLNASALVDYQLASEILPDQSEIHFKIGAAHDLMNQSALAIVAFQKALELNPNHFKSTHFLARTFMKADHKTEAFALYQNLLNRRPNSLEYLLKCASLCPSSIDRNICLSWIQKASKQEHATSDDLILCCELYTQQNDLVAAKNIYFKLRNRDLSSDQRRRCIALCETFGDIRESAFNHSKLISIQGTLFSQRNLSLSVTNPSTLIGRRP